MNSKHHYWISIFLIISSLATAVLIEPDFNPIGAAVIEESIQEDVLSALLQAESDINEMKRINLPSLLVRDTLIDAKRYYIGVDNFKLLEEISKEKKELRKSYLLSLNEFYEATESFDLEREDKKESLRLAKLIHHIKEQSLRLKDTVDLLDDKKREYEEDGANVILATEVLSKAKAAFKEERYDEAEALLAQAESKLNEAISERTRVKKAIEQSRNFIQRSWWQLLITFTILIILAKPTISGLKRNWAKNKLKSYKLELKTLEDLIRNAQIDCFEKRKTSITAFKIRTERYNKKMAEIKRKIPVLEGIISKRKSKQEMHFEGGLKIK